MGSKGCHIFTFTCIFSLSSRCLKINDNNSNGVIYIDNARDDKDSLLQSKIPTNISEVDQNFRFLRVKNKLDNLCIILWPLNDTMVTIIDSQVKDVCKIDVAFYCFTLNYTKFAGYIGVNDYYAPLDHYDAIHDSVEYRELFFPCKQRLFNNKIIFHLFVYKNNSADHDPYYIGQILILPQFLYSSFPTVSSDSVTALNLSLTSASLATYMAFRKKQEFGMFLNSLHLLGLAIEVRSDQGIFATQFLSKWKGRYYLIVDIDTEIVCTQASSHPTRNQSSTRKQDEDLYTDKLKRLSELDRRVSIIRLSSTGAAMILANNSSAIEFVYLHPTCSTDDVERDLRLWWDVLKTGGVLGGHGVHLPWVADALMQFSIRMNVPVLGTADDSWYAFK